MPWVNQYARYRKLYDGTASEHALEPAIASLGIPYRWQMPVGNYFLDFALPTLRVAIEVDGDSHDRPDQKAKDRERTKYLTDRGWRVVRCRNEEAQGDPYGTVERLCAEAGLCWRPVPRAVPSRS